MAFFKSFKVPVSKEMEDRFEQAVCRLEEKLLAIDIEALPVSPYSKKYFKDYQRKLKYSLQACSFILMHALRKSGKNIAQISIVDYGAGTGVLAMLAKEVGFGKVVYNDIYDISCNDAETIAKQADAQAHAYVCGDISSVKSYFEASNQQCDIIVSRNVIEHIYNLESFFQALSTIPNNGLTLFFATTANIKNPLTVWYTQRIQRMLEYKGMTTKWGKERDSLKPYLTSRKEIIQQEFPQFNNIALDKLAAATRGLIKDEIIEAVKTYIRTEKIVVAKISGTNTCDPFTGNWAEHLVEIELYEDLYHKNNFDFEVISGFYNTNYSQKVLNFITPLVNYLIRKTGKRAIYLAPFIGLQGKKQN